MNTGPDWNPKSTPCWKCEHWDGWAQNTFVAGERVNMHALCARDNRAQPTPENGCAYWTPIFGEDFDVAVEPKD